MAVYTAIDDPSAYFKVQFYTGTGSSLAVTFDDTDTDMQPDFLWLKCRSAATSSALYDAVRGVTKELVSDSNAAESTVAEGVTAFGSDGFTVGTDGPINTSSRTYVAWCWKANGSGSANTDGSINTTKTSANTTSGFSINTFTGSGSAATIGHGLGVVPRFIISKDYGGTNSWYVYHASVGNTHALRLDTNGSNDDSTGYWNDTTPTSSVYTVGDNSGTNDTDTMVSYVFADVQGFSKFGSYVGNANNNGPFAFLGFRPAWLVIKNHGEAEGWYIWDSKRLGYNADNNTLRTDHDGAAGTGNYVDLLSNGFKITDTNAAFNRTGTAYSYMAFAEAPFVNSNGVPCNAR